MASGDEVAPVALAAQIMDDLEKATPESFDAAWDKASNRLLKASAADKRSLRRLAVSPILRTCQEANPSSSRCRPADCVL